MRKLHWKKLVEVTDQEFPSIFFSILSSQLPLNAALALVFQLIYELKNTYKQFLSVPNTNSSFQTRYLQFEYIKC